MDYRTREEVLGALRDDHEWYARRLLKIVDKRSQLVSLEPRPAQKKLYAAIQRQRAAGVPVRILVLKSRKVGISTSVQGVIVQNCTQRSYRNGLIVAQDGDTAASLFEIGERMYVNLPADPIVKPPLRSRANTARNRHLAFGHRPGQSFTLSDQGLGSKIAIDTANEVEAGRGKTITDLHCSEAAFWRDPGKALSLLNAVPDEPETYIFIESTANGSNWFKSRCDRAMRGEGEYELVFIGWPEDPDCTRSFPTEQARAAFIETIGTGPYGKDEPRLIEKFGCTPEQLFWRRTTIVDKCEGKLELFKQEYPSSPEEAFIGSGKHVFAMQFIQRALDRAEAIEKLPPSLVTLGGPQQGLILPAGTKTRNLAYGTVDVPTGAMWVPRAATGFDDAHPFWTLWRMPWRGVEDVQHRFNRGLGGLTELDVATARALTEELGQYIVTIDPAGGEENTAGDRAFHAIEVIDHRTGDQVAEYASRQDPDEIALQALLVGLWFNEAWISVEITGGYGYSIARKLWKDFGYRRVYKRKRLEGATEKQSDLLGWSTDRRTKPMMEDTLREELREGTHGIRSRPLALELTTYVRLSDGSHGPDAEAFADRLTSYMQGKRLRAEIPLRPARPQGEHSSLTRDLGGLQ